MADLLRRRHHLRLWRDVCAKGGGKLSATTDRQLVLPLSGRSRYADFLPAPSNAAARQWLDHPHEWPASRLVLWGEAGCGKTHLAHRWAEDGGLWLQHTALPALPDLAPQSKVVVDNADRSVDHPALLHLVNTCAEAGCVLLMTGRSPPSRWGISLADLTSRLLATQAIAVDPPEDTLLQALLARLLAERQLVVAEPVQQWLLQRLPRTAAALQEAAARLDNISFVRQQPITRVLARASLSDLLGDLNDNDDSTVMAKA